jgi:hypothetical protein
MASMTQALASQAAPAWLSRRRPCSMITADCYWIRDSYRKRSCLADSARSSNSSVSRLIYSCRDYSCLCWRYIVCLHYFIVFFSSAFLPWVIVNYSIEVITLLNCALLRYSSWSSL